jgi:uncharacterized protein
MPNPKHLILETNVPAEMRDGIILSADIYFPEVKDQIPAVLNRIPYHKVKQLANGGAKYIDFRRIALSGFALVVQDCLGTGSSGGGFQPWGADDQTDGANRNVYHNIKYPS